MNSSMRLKTKMDVLEYLNALRSAMSLAYNLSETEWMFQQHRQLTKMYGEAQAIFAHMFKDD